MSLGFLLRLYRIGAEGLWIDEAFSVWMARQPPGQMLRWVIHIDQHPPLYYALLRLWIRVLGDGEANVRMLSAFFGTLTIPVIYLLGRRLINGRVGLLSALILAVSPFHVRFAQEARMYTLLTLNVSLAMYAFSRLVSGCIVSGSKVGEPETSSPKLETPAWLGYVVFTAATLWTHNTAIFFPLAIILFVLGGLLCRRPPCSPRGVRPPRGVGPLRDNALRDCALASLLLRSSVPLLLWLPWLPAFISQSAGVLRRFWLPTPTLGAVLSAAGVLLIDFLPLPLVGICVVTGALVALALLGLMRLRRRPAHAALLLVVFATPFAGEWLVSLVRPIFYDRTLIWASLPLYLLLATGTYQLKTGLFSFFERIGPGSWRSPIRKVTFCQPRIRFLAALIMLLVINGLSLREYYLHFEKEQWDDAAALVAERVKSGDLILFNATWGQLPFDYYFHHLYNRPIAEHGVPVDLFDRGVLEPRMTESDLPRLRTLVQGRDRIWLIYSHAWYTDAHGLIPPALKKERDLLGRWEFHGVQVWEYGRE